MYTLYYIMADDFAIPSCISKCYKAGSVYFHPIYLIYLKENFDSCAINVGNTNEYNLSCTTAKEDVDIIEHQVYPDISISDENFLYIYYFIRNINSGFKWLIENWSEPNYTKTRIFNCLWRIYNRGDFIIYNSTTEAVILFLKNIWFDDIYTNIAPYIHIKKDIVELGDKTESFEFNELKKKFILSQFINSDYVNKFMTKYYKQIYESTNNAEQFKQLFIDSIISKSRKLKHKSKKH